MYNPREPISFAQLPTIDEKGESSQSSSQYDINQNRRMAPFSAHPYRPLKLEEEEPVETHILSVEEVLEYGDNPFWTKMRFWAWIFYGIILVAFPLISALHACLFVMPCPSIPDLRPHHKGAMYQLNLRYFDPLPDGSPPTASLVERIHTSIPYIRELSIKVLWLHGVEADDKFYQKETDSLAYLIKELGPTFNCCKELREDQDKWAYGGDLIELYNELNEAHCCAIEVVISIATHNNKVAGDGKSFDNCGIAGIYECLPWEKIDAQLRATRAFQTSLKARYPGRHQRLYGIVLDWPGNDTFRNLSLKKKISAYEFYQIFYRLPILSNWSEFRDIAKLEDELPLFNKTESYGSGLTFDESSTIWTVNIVRSDSNSSASDDLVDSTACAFDCIRNISIELHNSDQAHVLEERGYSGDASEEVYAPVRSWSFGAPELDRLALRFPDETCGASSVTNCSRKFFWQVGALRGPPVIYSGDELGITESDVNIFLWSDKGNCSSPDTIHHCAVDIQKNTLRSHLRNLQRLLQIFRFTPALQFGKALVSAPYPFGESRALVRLSRYFRPFVVVDNDGNYTSQVTFDNSGGVALACSLALPTPDALPNVELHSGTVTLRQPVRVDPSEPYVLLCPANMTQIDLIFNAAGSCRGFLFLLCLQIAMLFG